jgi:hypothetical protein
VVAVEDLDFDVVPLQPLRQAQPTCSRSYDADPKSFAHRARLHALWSSRNDRYAAGNNCGFWQKFLNSRNAPVSSGRMIAHVGLPTLSFAFFALN